jgi:hypothetical protein
MCSYAGGMRGSKTDDADFAHDTFEFLKRAMRSNSNNSSFHIRGPEKLIEGNWEYKNNFSGDIYTFNGHEEIYYKGEFVFEHDYFGGLLKDGRK